MRIHFTRHAKNRKRLYGITDEEVETALVTGRHEDDPNSSGGKRVTGQAGNRQLKVCYVIEKDQYIIKTMWVEKRGR